MSINPRFISYFEEYFFPDKKELGEFLASLEKGIPRTIRIRPGKEDIVKSRLSAYGFTLEDTSIGNVFSLGRREDFDPKERRIGYSLDHLVGNFYIQELAAATSVDVLSDGKIHRESYAILDMAASPGGKTTQLAEHYPESFIIANEPTRERIPQLLQNLDRMGSANIGVTLYPGQYFRHTPEVFDRILLDAPCSGEGTLYKGTDATKHWHIKNIKTIARLQEKLLDASLIALKVGGEMVYSTCSMNILENEGVLEAMKTKYKDAFTIIYQKHFWPHIDKTGGFFVAKIIKTKSIEQEHTERPVHINEELKIYHGTLKGEKIIDAVELYEHTGKILAVKKIKPMHHLAKLYYLMRLGERIGHIQNGVVTLEPFAHRYIDTKHINRYDISDEDSLDIYLRGGNLEVDIPDMDSIIVSYQDIDISLESIQDHILSNSFPHDWRRK